MAKTNGSGTKENESGGATDFWFERSQSYAASVDLAKHVADAIDDDGASGSVLRGETFRLVGTIASAVSTARDQLVAKLHEAYDRTNGVAGLFVMHADLANMSAEKRRPIREQLAAIAGLLFGLRRSITQERG